MTAQFLRMLVTSGPASCLARNTELLSYPVSPLLPVGSGRGGAMGVQGKGGPLPSDIAPPPPQNFCSRAALEALGSCLNNKYSEGYPGKR